MKASSATLIIASTIGCLTTACADTIAPIILGVSPCAAAEPVCPDEFFCVDGLCLRAGGPQCGDGTVQSAEGDVKQLGQGGEGAEAQAEAQPEDSKSEL